jgi:hypothetical protein
MTVLYIGRTVHNPLNAKLNPICYLLALLGAHHILHVSRIRVKFHSDYCVTSVAIVKTLSHTREGIETNPYICLIAVLRHA